MATGDGHQDARGEDVGALGNRSALFPSPGRGERRLSEHVENGRDTEVQRLVRCRSPTVGVAVDEARQQGHTGGVDLRRAGDGRQIGGDGGYPTIAN